MDTALFESSFKLGQQKFLQGNFDESRSSFLHALEAARSSNKSPKETFRCILCLSSCLLELKRFSEAKGFLDEALAVKPDNQRALFARALAHFHMGQWGACISDFEEASGVDNEISEQASAFTKALDEEIPRQLQAMPSSWGLDEIVAMRSKPQIRAEIEKKVANALFARSNFVGAVRYYTEAIDLDPQNAVLFCNRAAAYTNLALTDFAKSGRSPQDVERKITRLRRAWADSNSAVNLKSDYTKAYFRRANANFHLHNFDKALKDYEIAESQQGDVQKDIVKTLKAKEEDTKGEGLASFDSLRMPSLEAVKRACADPGVADLLEKEWVQQLLQGVSDIPETTGAHDEVAKRGAILKILSGVSVFETEQIPTKV